MRLDAPARPRCLELPDVKGEPRAKALDLAHSAGRTTTILFRDSERFGLRHLGLHGETRSFARDGAGLDEPNCFCTRPPGAFTPREFHALADAELFETHAVQRGRVEEQVVTFRRTDETEAPIGQTFDTSFSQLSTPFLLVIANRRSAFSFDPAAFHASANFSRLFASATSLVVRSLLPSTTRTYERRGSSCT